MKNKIVRLNETDLEKLVQKILKEEGELNQGSQTKVERVIDSATMEALIKMIKSKSVDDQINIVMQILNPMDLKGSFGRGLKMALDRAVKNTPN